MLGPEDTGRRAGFELSTFSTVASLGFAIFLTINATQVWGGIFPFLPADFQTQTVTLLFYLAQSISFVLALVASVVGSYWHPAGARRMLVTLAAAMVTAGSLSIIWAMYAPQATLALVVFGGAAMGVGTAAFFMLWQRLFSSEGAQACNRQLMVGTVLSAVLYYALYLVPRALTAFLIPVVLLPLGSLCLALSARAMDFDQPMFQDVPREHPHVYRRLLSDSRRGMAAIAAMGFACGLSRGVAVAEPNSLGEFVNVVSMAGSFIAALAMLLLWRLRSARFGMTGLFLAIYPVIMTGILMFPFIQSEGLTLFAGITYLVFSAAVLVMMMQTAQMSRDRGTNPVFAYGAFAIAAYGAQGLGFLLGWFADGIDILGVGRVAILSLLAAYVMGMALLFAIRRSRDGELADEGRIELIRARRASPADLGTPYSDVAERVIIAQNERAATMTQSAAGADGARDAPGRIPVLLDGYGAEASLQQSDEGKQDRPSQPAQRAAARFDDIRADDLRIRDRLSKQCLVARDVYMLSTREAEVMELIARGKTVATIAEELFISENTVRTHSKHIYTKLDVHSKQELSTLLEAMDLGR